MYPVQYEIVSIFVNKCLQNGIVNSLSFTKDSAGGLKFCSKETKKIKACVPFPTIDYMIFEDRNNISVEKLSKIIVYFCGSVIEVFVDLAGVRSVYHFCEIYQDRFLPVIYNGRECWINMHRLEFIHYKDEVKKPKSSLKEVCGSTSSWDFQISVCMDGYHRLSDMFDSVDSYFVGYDPKIKGSSEPGMLVVNNDLVYKSFS